MKIWQCKIGEVDREKLPNGSDLPMRQAVGRAYRELTGQDPCFVFSGWGASLTEGERAVVENREPVQRTKWFVVPDYRPNGDPATSATVVDRAGQQIAHFESIADAEIAVEAVNGRE